jgi:hypothetical protein
VFEFDPKGRYMMPAHFGSPRIEGAPSGWYHDVTTMNVSYLTDREKLATYLPAPFSVADEALITVTYACSKKIDWLAGHGYNLISVNAAAVFDGEEDKLEGTFALVIWENLADPILTGRELTGIPKIFADIPEHTIVDGQWHCNASHFGNPILEMTIGNLVPPTQEQIIAAQKVHSGGRRVRGLDQRTHDVSLRERHYRGFRRRRPDRVEPAHLGAESDSVPHCQRVGGPADSRISSRDCF